MSDEDSSPRSWRAANVALLAAALALVVALVVLLGRDAGASSAGTSHGSAATVERSLAEVTHAARSETEAFLGVDYRAPDPMIDRVLAGAAGHFKQEYAAGRAGLKASTRKSHAVSTGRVVSLGVSELGATRATVLVAANARVTNRSTKGSAEPRYYRLRLTLVHRGETWLTSRLEFVG